jgi:hypothetical protein
MSDKFDIVLVHVAYTMRCSLYFYEINNSYTEKMYLIT